MQSSSSHQATTALTRRYTRLLLASALFLGGLARRHRGHLRGRRNRREAVRSIGDAFVVERRFHLAEDIQHFLLPGRDLRAFGVLADRRFDFFDFLLDVFEGANFRHASLLWAGEAVVSASTAGEGR